MADAEARRAAIKKASRLVRAGGVFGRATRSSKVTARSAHVADELECLRAENLDLVDAMRDARGLILQNVRPQAMAAAALLGAALQRRVEAMLPESGEDDPDAS